MSVGARMAQRRPLPKPRKMHGPVGTPVDRWAMTPDPLKHHQGGTCRGCGYHVCSCERQRPVVAVDPPIAPFCGGCHRISKLLRIDVGTIDCYEPSCANHKPAPFSTFQCCGKPANVGGHASDCRWVHETENAKQKWAGFTLEAMQAQANSPETKAFQAKMTQLANEAMAKTSKRVNDTSITESEYGRMRDMGEDGRHSRYGDSPRLAAFRRLHERKLAEQAAAAKAAKPFIPGATLSSIARQRAIELQARAQRRGTLDDDMVPGVDYE